MQRPGDMVLVYLSSRCFKIKRLLGRVVAILGKA